MDERAVQQELSEWLQRETDCEVYWGEDPDGEFGRFGYAGLDDRPDMLITGGLNVVTEVKDGADSAGIYNAMSQLHRYWKAYEYDDASVHVDGDEVSIDAFILATQYSQDGHLFKPEREQGQRETYDPQSEGWNKTHRPQFEYARTEAIPRIQWRYAWHEAEQRQTTDRSEIGCGLGVLLSDKLDESPEQASFADFDSCTTVSTRPMILTYSGNEKSQWQELK
ncbi:hypothetical protein [Halobacterium zhouii]|uniref:hypothetical protein n=1 Tax=Halobacterium zhouii TaxID=2902624 RepID=UPI001E38C11A|nr:hypothetical protein [Halobacterium zhouii]